MNPTLKTYLRKGTSSLRNHILLVQLCFSLPMSLMFMVFAYQDNDFTFARVLWIVFVWLGAGTVGGFIGWYVVLPPFRRRS